MITLVNENLSWYLTNGIITREAANDLSQRFDLVVKDLVPHINDCVEALGVNRNEKLHGPISRDYVQFNSQRDMKNFDSAGSIFDFSSGATPQK